MKLFKKKDTDIQNGQKSEEKPSKLRFVKKMYTPFGYKSNKEFVKAIFVPKEAGFLRSKIKDFFSEVKYRLTTSPRKFQSYNDWKEYMGVVGAEKKDIKTAIKRYFATPTIVMSFMLVGALFFCDMKLLNWFIYLSCVVIFPFIFVSYRYWNFIVDHEEYISFREWFKK